jgi:cytochrome c biogenesis protein CcdA
LLPLRAHLGVVTVFLCCAVGGSTAARRIHREIRWRDALAAMALSAHALLVALVGHCLDAYHLELKRRRWNRGAAAHVRLHPEHARGCRRCILVPGRWPTVAGNSS